FVGLVVPHMMRLIVGPDHRYLIPASALGGASILLLTDAAARTLIPPLEIPGGALTALLGAPYFLYLLKRRKDAGEFCGFALPHDSSNFASAARFFLWYPIGAAGHQSRNSA